MEGKNLTYQTIAPFLIKGENSKSRWIGYIGLGIGVMLLLSAAQMYININQLLREKNTRKDGFDFISITKTITNENMGQDNRFNFKEIEQIKSQPFVSDAAPLISNQFRAKASAGTIVPFSTELFLESISKSFLDTLPQSFTWQPGQTDVPIIFSSDFLEMYNVFAPTQDLPQLSAATVTSLNVILECYGTNGMEMFRGKIVALSDRINSVLVPEEFLSWANNRYGGSTEVPPSRVYIKTTDANNPELLSYIEEKGYYVNKDRTRFGRIKQILEAVVSGLGGFAILVILLAMMLFSFYLQLMIARSKDNLKLLLLLGYSPGWLSRKVSNKWIPVYTMIILSGLVLTAIVQVFFYKSVPMLTTDVSPFPSLYVIALALVLLIICVWVNKRLIRKLLFKL